MLRIKNKTGGFLCSGESRFLFACLPYETSQGRFVFDVVASDATRGDTVFCQRSISSDRKITALINSSNQSGQLFFSRARSPFRRNAAMRQQRCRSTKPLSRAHAAATSKNTRSSQQQHSRFLALLLWIGTEKRSVAPFRHRCCLLSDVLFTCHITLYRRASFLPLAPVQ